MYGRRGGLKHAFSKIHFQRHLVRFDLKECFAAALDGLMRSVMFIVPSGLRAFAYTIYSKIAMNIPQHLPIIKRTDAFEFLSIGAFHLKGSSIL